MDELNVIALVDFKAPASSAEHGIYGARINERMESYPDQRFLLFANPPLDTLGNRFLGDFHADYGNRLAAMAIDAVNRGARGFKIKIQAGAGPVYDYWTYRSDGSLLRLDAPELRPFWQTVERLRVPVLLHVAGARRGEHQGPEGDNRHVRWEMLMIERERLLRRYPQLIVIGAHWGSSKGFFEYVDEVLSRYPNFYVEGGANEGSVSLIELDSLRLSFFARHQDRILFGTDYMEHTQRWMRSYRQRLTSFLDIVEPWPIPDSVRHKYYHANARRLLRIGVGNRAPMTHPGFGSVHPIGTCVTLDGRHTLDLDGDSVSYRWRQTSGPPVTLSDSGARTTRFLATRRGVYRFVLVTGDRGPLGDPREVQVTIIDPAVVFREENGWVSLEAEHAMNSDSDEPLQWRTEAAAIVSPTFQRHRFDANYAGRAPESRYAFSVTNPGTYVVYVRGKAVGPDTASVHVGLDDMTMRLSERVGPFVGSDWSWSNTSAGWDDHYLMPTRSLAVLNIAEAGPHVLNVWLHRGPVRIDKILLVRHPFSQTRYPLYSPGRGSGPAESPRSTLVVDSSRRCT